MVMYKHVGKIINTDARCIVVFMQIPQREDHALVINMDSIPPHFERPIRQVLESQDGQSAITFGEVLGRRLMPDTGVRILDALHNARLLHPVHIDNVVMMPRPSMAFPLRQVIAAVNAESAKTLPAQTDFSSDKFNPHLHNQAVRSVEERVNIARNLLAEATELSKVANTKVQKAYDMAPELRPGLATTWIPLSPLPVVDDVVDPASVLMEASIPEVRHYVVETPTASMSEIERYAAMMAGEFPDGVPTAPTEKRKAPKKTTIKAPKKSA